MLEQAVEKRSLSPDRCPDRDGSRVEREAGEIRTEHHLHAHVDNLEPGLQVNLRFSSCLPEA